MADSMENGHVVSLAEHIEGITVRAYLQHLNAYVAAPSIHYSAVHKGGDKLSETAVLHNGDTVDLACDDVYLIE